MIITQIIGTIALLNGTALPQAVPSQPESWIIASTKSPNQQFDMRDFPPEDAFVEGVAVKGSFIIRVVEGQGYVIDRDSLGFEFTEQLSKTLKEVANTEDASQQSKLLTKAMMPMIWSPMRQWEVTHISPLEIVPGYGLKLEEPGGKAFGHDHYKPFEKRDEPSFQNISTEWSKGFKETRLLLNDVSMSVGGRAYPNSNQLRAMYEHAFNLVWEDYIQVRDDYNESIEMLRDRIMPGAFPFLVDSSIEGKTIGSLSSAYQAIQSDLFDPNSPNKDWSGAKILKATQEVYIRGKVKTKDGKIENFQFLLPSKIE